MCFVQRIARWGYSMQITGLPSAAILRTKWM